MNGRKVSHVPTVSSGTDIMLLDKITNIKKIFLTSAQLTIVYKVNSNHSYGPFHEGERAGIVLFYK